MAGEKHGPHAQTEEEEKVEHTPGEHRQGAGEGESHFFHGGVLASTLGKKLVCVCVCVCVCVRERERKERETKRQREKERERERERGDKERERVREKEKD